MKFKLQSLVLVLMLMSVYSFAASSTEIIAHRGGAALAPENTLAAISKSIELGVEWFEVDVRTSMDDSLMIMHDETIDRTTDGTGNVSSMYYLHLRFFDAGSWFGPDFAGEKIPTLAEVLDLALSASYDIGIVIELKAVNSTIVQKVIDEVQKRNLEDRVIISSFTLSQLEESKQIDPTIPVQLFGTIGQTQINQVNAIGGEWVGTGGTVTEALVDSVHAKNMFINKWTINTADAMLTHMALGVDAISTDNPDLALVLRDDTPPSDVVMNNAVANVTRVKLTWTSATDDESGISGYEIYRDTDPNAETLIATVGDTNVYIDETQVEEETFYYRMKAINQAGLLSENYSNELSVTTETDTRAPKIGAISAFGVSSKVIVQFNERIDPTTAENVANYAIDNEITVNFATLALDSMSVFLDVSTLSPSVDYTITVTGVEDEATVPNAITDPEVVTFQYYDFLSQTVGAWNVDQFSGTVLTDLSGNANDGTLTNDVAWAAGFTGNGLKFDGVDDYVNIPSSTSLNISTDAVTLSLWTKLAYLPADLPGAYGPMYDSDTDNYVMYEDKGNNELRFKVTTVSSAERPGIPAADLVTDEWIHVCGVYDGSTAKIYLNGELKDSHNLTGNIKANSGDLFLGRTGSVYFEGSIDNIYVLDRALAEDEIMFMYEEARKAIIDVEPPVVTEVASVGNPEKVYVHFDEKVDIFAAETISNYSIDNGATITAAQVCVDESAVVLSVSELADDVAYTLTVGNIEDQADEPNMIETTQVTFAYKPFPDNLVSFWSLDQGSDTTIVDETANANVGTLKNEIAWADSKYGNGLDFDGVDDYVLIPSTESLNIDTNSVSIAVWVKLDYLPADMPGPYGPIYDSDSDNYVLYEDRGNNELRFKVTTSSWWAERPGIPGADLVAGEWIHVVGTYDGNSASVYLNGELKDSHTLNGNIMANSGDLFLGRTGSTYFNGAVDHIQVYNRGLTAQEVAYLYSGYSAPSLSVNDVSEMSVTLNWSHQADPISGVSGYNVYRDTSATETTLIASLGDTNSYTDFTGMEFTGFYYRIKSVDASGVESDYFSNEVMATTEADVTAPEVEYALTTGEAGKVFVQFTEPVDSMLAITPANYVIDNSVAINSIQLSKEHTSVILSTSEMSGPETEYTLTINGINDKAQTPNTIASDTKAMFNFNPYLKDIVAYWSLDEDGDTIAVDITGNGNKGTLQNDPMRVDGKIGNALDFDGTGDCVLIPSTDYLNIDTNCVTLSAWVKLDYLPADMPGPYGPIYDSDTDNYVLYEDKWNRELRFKVTTVDGAERPGIPAAMLVTDEWIHVCGVYDGETARVYLNGEMKDTHNLTGNIKANSGDLFLGKTGTTYFNGQIDNVQVYRRALDEQAINYLATFENYPTAITNDETVPTEFALYQNYPNPFNPTTTIAYSLSKAADVSIVIYDILGKKVAELVNAKQSAGVYRVNWNGRNNNGNTVASGMYFYRIKTGKFVATKKMVLMR